MTIDGVKEAIVTINVPEEKNFAWETNTTEPSASVKVNLKNGKSLSSSQTDGIMQLVVKSVKGLKEENVAIIDTDGNSLVASGEIKQTNTIKLKLEIEKQFEKETIKNVSEFLAKIYGEENIKVSAKCTINFDKKISEMLQYLPDEETKLGVPGSTQNQREITGPGETVGGISGTESNAEVPTYPGVVVEGDNIYFKDSNSINYLVSQLKEQIGIIRAKLSAAVAAVINKASIRDEELTEVKELIAFSAGISTEDIALHNMLFYDPNAPAQPAISDEVNTEQITMREILIYGGIALAVLSVLIFILSIVLRKRKKKKEALEAAKSKAEAEAAAAGDFSWQDIQDGIKLQETQEQAIKKQLKEFTTTNPEIAAQLINLDKGG